MARAILLLALAAVAGSTRLGVTGRANPIRKVVTMLQNVQKKVEAEGKKEEDLFEKYMCYCKNGVGTLEKGIQDAEVKITDLEASVKESASQKAQLDQDLKSAKADRATAEEAVGEATQLRQKEANEYAAFKAESETNIASVGKAIVALEKGMAGSAFLQTMTGTAQRLRGLAEARDMPDAQRQKLMSFLAGGAGEHYAPQSGEIVGILKQMKDDMEQDLADATAAEEAAIKAYEELSAAKSKEIEALNAAIEEKTARSGELAMALAEMKNDLEDTSASLVEDKKFLADLQKNCATKEKEWDEIVKTRGEEMLALADTIKLLNDDDALELFKKTLPGSAASFMQVQVSAASVRARALEVIHAAQQSKRPMHHLDFVALALHGKESGFDKVVAMIDNMVGLLKNEQAEDDKKKAYCNEEFDISEDKKKGLERQIADEETAIEAAKETVAALADDIEALSAGIKALDASVEEATKQRKEENSAFKELMAENGAAKDLLGMAKNRLNKFYNPKLYAAAPKREFTELVQDAPAPPPEAPGPYKKNSEESTGVIAMMDILVNDLDKEMTLAEAEEKDAQADYEKAMKDAAEKRAQDSKMLGDKKAAKADTEEALQEHEEEKASGMKELAATMQYIQSLHADCDWLLKYFDTRKEARADEANALGNAKAVLNGADYSFLQVVSRHLRGF